MTASVAFVSGYCGGTPTQKWQSSAVNTASWDLQCFRRHFMSTERNQFEIRSRINKFGWLQAVATKIASFAINLR